MTESNTPPENQKKKSAFSRFFSRKKTQKTEDTKPSTANTPDPDQLSEQTQPITPTDKPVDDVDSKAKSSEPTVVDSINAQPLVEKTASDILQESNASFEAPTDTTIQEQLSNSNESGIDEKVLKNDIITNEEPLVDKKPNITQESSTVTEPSVSTPSLTAEQSTLPSNNVETPAIDNNDKPTLEEQPLNIEQQPNNAEQANVETNPSVATVEEGLNKSRTSFFQKISNVFKGSFNLNDDLFDELEELLITSDIGIEASLSLVEKLRVRVKKEKIQDADGVVLGLRSEITEMLQQSEQAWQFQQKPYVILMVGVNGAGKTTTTAKIAKHFQDQGKSVMLAAADTFRAAAVEQLQEWGQRLDIPVIAQEHGADAAAVAHDALTSAIARNVDILMIDTAGRLHTQSDLMEQLSKVNRVLAKIDPSTPHEVMQILDAGTGQNALTQLEHFQKAVGVSSICLSKLDGSAKGGIAISLSEKTKLPIRFIGTGEGFADLQQFSAQQFADALVPSLK